MIEQAITPLAGARILVVEDEEVLRVLTDDILSEEGFIVSQVPNAEEGLKYLAEHSQECDVVLVDVRMPGALDGIDFAHVVEAVWPHISIVIVSGYSNSQTPAPRSAVMLRKPWRLDTLVAAVTTASKKRML